MSGVDAERAALAYAYSVRKLLYEASLNAPMKPSEDVSGFSAAMDVFLKRDPALYAEAKATMLGSCICSHAGHHLTESAITFLQL